MTSYFQTKQPLLPGILLIAGLISMLPQRVFSQVLQSSNLPIIIIDTKGAIIKDEPKVTAQMVVIYTGEGNTNQISDSANVTSTDYKGSIGIEYRGASSQDLYPKKSYGIEIHLPTGESQDVSLLGMPKESDWVLYAPYGDKSLIRDVLTYNIGNQMGRYAPHTKFCELIVNGEYQGVHVLIEKIKRNKNRVKIDKLDPAEISGDALTGGYIIKIDKNAGNVGDRWASNFLNSNRTTFFQYEYPKSAAIVAQQKKYIQEYINNFETVLHGNDFASPTDGYAKYIDVASFIDYMIVTELCKNVDGYRLSFYMHKDKESEGGKLNAGPLWDYNLAYGNANYCQGGSYTGFAMDFNTTCPNDTYSVPFWWKKFLTDPAFTEKLYVRWKTLRLSLLKKETLMDKIDVYALQLQQAQTRNFVRWPILGKYVWPNSFIGNSYADEVNYMKSWLSSRLIWLDKKWSQPLPGEVTALEENIAAEMKFQASPNPFSQEVRLQYTLKQSGKVTIKIHTLLGKLVATLTDPKSAVGNRELLWDGRDSNRSEVASGLYICTVEKEGKVVASCKLQKMD